MYYYNQTGNFQPPRALAQHAEKEKQLAQAYVPEQKFRMLYSAEDALKYGTVFEELNQSYRRR